MDLIPFRPEHLAAIEPPLPRDVFEFFRRAYHPLGPAWTAVANAQVVGCGGIIVEGDVGEAWAIVSQPVRTIPAHRAALRALDEASRIANLRRIDAAALMEWPAACRWLERLGFRPEGIEGDYRRYMK